MRTHVLVGEIAVGDRVHVIPIVLRVRKRTSTKRKALAKPEARERHLVSTEIAPFTLPAATPVFGIPVTIGSIDSNDWLRALGIQVRHGQHWFVEIALGIDDEPLGQLWSGATDTRFQVYIYPQEWGFLFSHRSRTSWIRVADRAYVHGRDDYDLVGSAPPLREIAAFARGLEQRHRVQFRRDHALVRSNLYDIDERVRGWVGQL